MRYPAICAKSKIEASPFRACVTCISLVFLCVCPWLMHYFFLSCVRVQESNCLIAQYFENGLFGLTAYNKNSCLIKLDIKFMTH